MRKPRFLAILLLTPWVGTFAQTAAAMAVPAPQPTMQQVVNALDNVRRQNCHGFIRPCTSSSVTLEGDSTIHYVTQVKQNGVVFEEQRVTFDLKLVHASLVESNHAVWIKSDPNGLDTRIFVEQDNYGQGLGEPKMSPKLVAYFYGPAESDRFLKIMVYAIQLAKGSATEEALADFRQAIQDAKATTGPSIADTVEWLNARVPAYSKIEPFHAGSMIVPYVWTKAENEQRTATAVTRVAVIRTGRIKGVASDSCSTLAEAHVRCVRVTGDFQECDPPGVKDCSDIQEAHVFLSESTTQDEVDKIIKAVRHLAELNGATLAKDDLF